MPRRNLAIIAVVLVLSCLCAVKVRTNPYDRILADSMHIVEQNSLEKVEEKQLYEGAMTGMLKTLKDDYSLYMPPAEQQELNAELDSSFGGIGAHINFDSKTHEIVVLFTVYDSPAYKAGMRKGDKLLRIGNRSTQGMTSSDATELLHGKPGEKVTVTVLHEGDAKPCELEITRAEILVDTVEGDTRLDPGTWNFLLPGPEKIGYVRITSFSERTAKELERALDTLTKQNMQGLIVDVRENPGGLLTVACEICDLFLKKGETIVTIRHRDGSDEKTATGNGPYTGIPMAVIVNNDSASASEIFAACMQDHHRAAIVGQRTHGKGTVQQIIDLEKDCGAIRLTIASYWRPSGHNIQRKHGAPESEEWGVQPDPGCKIVVDGEERVKLMLWRMRRDTQLSGDASNDADDYRAADIQLKKAIECVEKEIK